MTATLTKPKTKSTITATKPVEVITKKSHFDEGGEFAAMLAVETTRFGTIEEADAWINEQEDDSETFYDCPALFEQWRNAELNA